MKTSDLRNVFLDYFKKRKHKIVKSAPLIPVGDPSLMFTTAGMVQFKPMFAGEVELKYTRAATCQKCLRTTDLENVGKTPRHHTFFEMLGNFSFGDYFKKEAVEWAYEFSTEIVKLDPDRLHFSIYQEDDEAFDLWNKTIGIPADRIVRLGREDNFWGPAGDTGACGPCSELYYDLGPEMSCGDESCAPGCDCDRYLEYWNLVFNQFYLNKKGEYEPLPQTGIDTGMGLERLALITQNKKSVYETDLFLPLIHFMVDIAKQDYNNDTKASFNVIADHIRAVVFALAEDILPSNVDRGYVIRKILRRAIRFGKLIGINHPFLYQIVPKITDIMGSNYPEIKGKEEKTANIIKAEEETFFQTLDRGMSYLNDLLSDLKKDKKNIIPGKEAFKLYDSLGFPYEVLEEIVSDEQFTIDKQEFDHYLQQQKEKGRASQKSSESPLPHELEEKPYTVEYVGNEQSCIKSKIKYLIHAKKTVKEAKKGEKILIITEKTPFYGESGGQMGDIGIMQTGDSKVDITDTQKYHGNMIVHAGNVVQGKIKVDQEIELVVDDSRKKAIARHHSATHLLQYGLKKILGDHVKQMGSLVNEEKLRFDFSHFKGVSQEEIDAIEIAVNQEIVNNHSVSKKFYEKEEALNMGALAFFGEKYDEKVRVVKMGDISLELCGGTHVDYTGEIGSLKIVSESSVASGIRRIEAVTGIPALKTFQHHFHLIKSIENKLNTQAEDIINRIDGLSSRIKEMEKEIRKIKEQGSTLDMEETLSHSKTNIKGVPVFMMNLPNTKPQDLRLMSDKIKAKHPQSIIILFSTSDSKAFCLIKVGETLVQKHQIIAKELINEILAPLGGKGGGKDQMAEGGGKDPSKLEVAQNKALEYITSKIQ